MIHGWAGSFQGAGPWASEGLATYFTANLQRRLGLQPLKAFVAELNRLSRQYYGNPYRNATNDAARAAFWADKNGELLPYVRGSLYFFALDAAIRQASGGARSLDDILLDLFARRAEGETVSVRTFTDALAKELGPGVAAELDSVVVRGTKTVFVPPDAFGPCFTHSLDAGGGAGFRVRSTHAGSADCREPGSVVGCGSRGTSQRGCGHDTYRGRTARQRSGSTDETRCRARWRIAVPHLHDTPDDQRVVAVVARARRVGRRLPRRSTINAAAVSDRSYWTTMVPLIAVPCTAQSYW